MNGDFNVVSYQKFIGEWWFERSNITEGLSSNLYNVISSSCRISYKFSSSQVRECVRVFDIIKFTIINHVSVLIIVVFVANSDMNDAATNERKESELLAFSRENSWVGNLKNRWKIKI